MKRWASVAMTFIGFAAIGVIAVNVSTSRAESVATSIQSVVDLESHGGGFDFSPLRALATLHESMLRDGSSLVVAQITPGGGGEGRAATLNIERVLWSPSAARQIADGTSLEARLPESTPSSEAGLLTRPFDRVVAVVDPDGILNAIAHLALASDEDLVTPPFLVTGPFFLAEAADLLLRTGYDPVPVFVVCDVPRGELQVINHQNHVSALSNYLSALGDTSQEARAAANLAIAKTVDDLVATAGRMSDPVTGRFVKPSRQDMIEQLRAGATRDTVLVRGAIPLAVRVGLEPTESIAVFVGSESDRPLGWTVMRPHYGTNAAGERTPLLERVVEIAPPDSGDDLLVFIRDRDDAWFSCGAAEGELPALVVPFDSFAGSQRAHVNVATHEYTHVTTNR